MSYRERLCQVLLDLLPGMHADTQDSRCALGPAMMAGHRICVCEILAPKS